MPIRKLALHQQKAINRLKISDELVHFLSSLLSLCVRVCGKVKHKNDHVILTYYNQKIESSLLLGAKLFVLTNSHFDYTSHLMEYSYGKDWYAPQYMFILE